MTIIYSCSGLEAQETTSHADEPYELRYNGVPRERNEIENALAEVRSELKQVTTQPATSRPATLPADDPAARLEVAQAGLWDALSKLETQLRDLLQLTGELDRASVQAATAKLSDQIERWRARITELTSGPPPARVDDEQIQQITAEQARAMQRLDALALAIAQQQDTSRGGFRAERDKLKSEATQVSAAVSAAEAAYTTAHKSTANEAERQILINNRRAAHARLVANEIARSAIDLREKAVQQQLERHALERDALQPYTEALLKRKDNLLEIKSQTRTERLRRKLHDPQLSPDHKLFLNLQLIHEETLSSLQKDYLEKIQGRFGPIALKTLESLGRDDEAWIKQLEESLGRRSAADVREAYEDAQEEEERAASEHRKKLDMLDRTFAEQRDIENMKRDCLARYDKIEKEFRKRVKDSSDPELIRMKQQAGQMRIELKNAFEDVPKIEEVRDNLKKAVAITSERLGLWQSARSRLYWAHLMTRGPSYFAGEVYAPVKTETESLPALLRQTINDEAKSLRLQIDRLEAIDWGLIIVAELILTCVLAWLWRRCRVFVSGEPPAGNPETQSIPFLDRLKDRASKAGEVVIPLIAPAAATFVLVFSAGLDTTSRTLLLVLSSIWVVTILVPGMLYIAFRASKTRYRVVPCSNVVARHYIRLGYAALILSLLFLAPALLLWSLKIAPETTQLLYEVFQFLMTLVVLLFLFRKEAVLNLVPRTQRGRFAKTVTALQAGYPIIVLLLIGLIVLRIGGYAAMANYITVGLAGTLGVGLLTWSVYVCVREIILWMVNHARRMRESYAPSPDTPSPEQAQATILAGASIDDIDAAQETNSSAESLPASARLTLTVVRWTLVGGGFLLALYAWQLRPYEIKQMFDIRLWEHGGQDVTLWRIGASILTLAITVLLSRGVRQALRSRLYPAHPGLDVGAQAAIDTLLHYIILLVGIYAALQTLRLDFGALAVLFGGLGLGLGLGLQPLIVNFVSGLIMLFERQVKVGDIVNMADKQGEVVRISMRSTIVRTPDGLHIIVPNGDFINQKVENWTLGHKPVRGVLDIAVSYRSDPERIRTILLEVTRHERLILRHPAAEVTFKEMNDTGMIFSIAGWFRNLSERGAGLLNMRYAIAERFNQEGIEVPVKALSTLTVGGDKKLSEAE